MSGSDRSDGPIKPVSGQALAIRPSPGGDVLRPELCLITNRHLCPEPLPVRAEKILAAGADLVMLREKDLPEERLLPLAEELAEAVKRHRRRLIVNSSLRTAVAVKAWALQLPLDQFLQLRSDSRLADFKVGVSIHSLEEARLAEQRGADWILAGHIFTTDCKPGRPGRGLHFIEVLKQRLCLPIWAVGGLHPGNIGQVAKTGIRTICLMSHLLQSQDPEQATRDCLAAVQHKSAKATVRCIGE